MSRLADIPLSVLDLAPIVEGGTASDSFRNSIDLAQCAERLGYRRYWVAEHHNMPGIASSATSVLIGRLAAATSTIRVGAGGIMLPNHAPLVIAEQFGTLEAMFPGRIDLGLGRAPGSDRMTAHALRRRLESDGDDFPELLQELRFFLKEPLDRQTVQAVPGAGANVPIWLLGSSDFSARLAGQLGLSFSFAAHFSPQNTLPALAVYRESFRPSSDLAQPYAMVAINIFAAETREEAKRLATSQHQSFLNLIRGHPGKIQPPVEDMDAVWSPEEKAMVNSRLGGSIMGDPEKVAVKLQKFADETAADEIMVNAIMFDHEARKRSYEIVAEIWKAERASSAMG
ncbi:MAG: LLM class flavin-dependent oxidoreductase [Acidobacteriota bacterium]